MSKQVTTIAGFLDEPRFGTTKSGKAYLQCSVPVKVETGRDSNNQYLYTTYRYSFTIWDKKADDFNTRGVLVKGQYVMLSGTVKMTPYINDHPKNPADKGKPGINIEFCPGFELDLGLRPPGAPEVPAKVYDNNQGGNQGGNYQNNNQGYNNRGGNNGGGNNYNNRGNSGGGNYQRNNYNQGQSTPPPPVQDQGWEDNRQDSQGQYANNYQPNPYE
jgi:hypothetical protein